MKQRKSILSGAILGGVLGLSYGLAVSLSLAADEGNAPLNRAGQASAKRGHAAAEPTRPASFPHRIWVAADFEVLPPSCLWFGNPEVSWRLKKWGFGMPDYPGNRTVLCANPRPIRNLRGDSALTTGFNPVPGGRMGKENYLYIRYFLKGTTEATFQYYSLDKQDNNHIHVTGLTEGKWAEATLNFTRDAARNDGSRQPFGNGERMDDLKIFIGKRNDGREYELFIDDAILFALDPELPPETEPFPNRVIFLAPFDTGLKDKDAYWPGDFEIVNRGAPAGSYWGVAQAVAGPQGRGKSVRLQINPHRAVGAQTKLRFRYHLSGASALTVGIFDVTDRVHRRVQLTNLPKAAWTFAYVDFTADGKRDDGKESPLATGHRVSDLFFQVEPDNGQEAHLYIDEVCLYDAGQK